MDGAAVVARGDVSEVFELVEEAFDAVTQPIGEAVVGYLDFAVAFGGDHGLRAGLVDEFSQGIVVVRFVGDDAGRGSTGEKLGRGRAVVGLPFGQDEAQRPALGVGEGVDFGGQPSSGTPQSLGFGPPFPPAACWWTRTSVVSSIRYWLSGSAVSESNTRSHTPALAQRVKRLCTVFHLPYRSGRSCHHAPDRRTHKTAFTNNRLSAAVRPRSPALPGKRWAIRCHCASESSYRPTMTTTPDRRIWSPMSHTFRISGTPNVEWS